jgi:ABC-type Fe3+-hydroxamate transport system substrate-binding protein
MSARPSAPSHPLTRRTLLRRAAVLAVPAAVLLAGCGGSSSTAGSSAGSSAPSSAAAPTYPVTVTGADGAVTLAKQPTAIVSLSPSATEMLYAIGAGAQVKAVDDQSNYPADAPVTKLSGFTPNVEAIAGYSPDLVVFSTDANGLAAGLKKLGIPALQLDAASTLEQSYSQEQALGQATGHVEEAGKLVARTQERIAAAVASVPKPETPVKVYHELDPTFFSVTSSTFIGDVYKQFGLTDIADQAKDLAGGYPQLSAEFVVTAAPDLIVLADTKCCKQTAEAVAKRPAFAQVPAVVKGHVLAADDDIASRWGPRVADFAEQVAAELSQA